MRYLIGTNAGRVVAKHAFSGDSAKIDEQIARLSAEQSDVRFEEVDETAFDASVMQKPKTQQSVEWEEFKATSPTPAQAVTYLAKALGLE